MNGLKYILATNNTTSPTNASAYGSTDLIRDTLQAARSNGGEPDLLVVSTNFMSGFATWGQAIQRIPAGETVFGTPINVLEAPFLHGVTIVEAPLLQPYTAIALTSSEVYIRNKRNPYWNLRGNRGDMVEGDWIAEMAIEVVNESHHAWVARDHGVLSELTSATDLGHESLSLSHRGSSVPDAGSSAMDIGRRSKDKGPTHVAIPRQPALSRRPGRSGSGFPRSSPTGHGIMPKSSASRSCSRSSASATTRRGRRTAGRLRPARARPGPGTLEQAELELQKLHMLAACRGRDVDEAWEAFGFDPPNRPFEVLCNYDTSILPLGENSY